MTNSNEMSCSRVSSTDGHNYNSKAVAFTGIEFKRWAQKRAKVVVNEAAVENEC